MTLATPAARPRPNRIRPILVVALVWAAITLFGAAAITGGDGSLESLVAHGPFWPAIAAGLFVLAVAAMVRDIDVAWQRAPLGAALRAMALPLVIVALIFAIAVALGLPSRTTTTWVLLNVLAVGFSEELMFRGLLTGALLGAGASPWRVLWITSVGFGAVHALNGLVTGAWLEACVQAVAATMSGVLFGAIRLRTGSLWPPIVLHALWDAAVFLMAAGRTDPAAIEAAPHGVQLLLPVLFVVPNLLWGLWLMRGVVPGRG